MKIVLASEIFYPDIGGPARYVDILAEKISDRGIDVSVITYSDKDTDDSDKNKKYDIYRVKRYGNILFRYVVYLFRLFQLVSSSDLIYAQGPLSSGLPAIIVGKIKGVRVVVKVVGDRAWESTYQDGKTTLLTEEYQTERLCGKLLIIRLIQNFVLKQADSVITVSKYFKNIIKKWGVDEKKIKVIYNSVSKVEGDIKDDKFYHLFEKKVIFSIGRMVKWKGFDILIDMMRDLSDEYVLCIAGDGPEKKNLEAKIKEMGLEDRVFLLGKLDRKQISYFLSNCFVFVLNSGYENCSHVILEAMQEGACILASDIGGNPELVEDKVSGYLFEYNNKSEIVNLIKKISSDYSLYEKIKKNSHKRFLDFSWDGVVDKTLNVLLDN